MNAHTELQNLIDNGEVMIIEGNAIKVVPTHRHNVKAGDTILIGDKLVTLCAKDFGNSPLFGTTIRGNSYNSGRKKVKVAKVARMVTDGIVWQ